MLKTIFLVTSIFGFLLTTCSAEGERFDIFDFGYDILSLREQKAHVHDLIHNLEQRILSDYQFFPSGQLDFSHMLRLLGVPRSVGWSCLTEKGRRGLAVDDWGCPSNILNNARIIEQFMKDIDDINDRLAMINSTYTSVFNNTNASAASESFGATDKLYEFIMEGCKDTSTCLFHQIAGKHASKINHGSSISTQSSVSGDVFYTYLIIIFNFIKGYSADIYRYDHTSNETDVAKIIELSRQKFVNHTFMIAETVMAAMKDAPTDIIPEEPSDIDVILGSPYLELKWYLGQIIVNEANLNPDHSCWKTCGDYTRTRFYKYGSVPSSGKHICQGTIFNCYHQNLGLVYPSISDSRRYGGVQGFGRSFGQINPYDRYRAKAAESMFYVEADFYDRCDVCTCLCDDHNNPETTRSFSLRAVTSNIAENKTITGLRLVEIEGMIYIQIQQGTLVEFDLVKDVSWLPVDTFDKYASPNDSFTLGYLSHNFVNLDTMSAQDEAVQHHMVKHDINRFFFPNSAYLLTGVKFINHNGVLSFAIRLNAWNSRSRTFSTRKWNNWIANDKVENRKRIPLNRPHLPTKTTDNVEFTGDNYYVQFQATDNFKDFGQTTVPFLDGRPIVANPPMPLSGAGLFYKGKEGFGGVIGLKLISIDFADLIVRRGA